MGMLFGRIEEDWSLETLMDSIKADHGFNMDSKSVKNLLQTMSELTLPERRDFLQFTTGSPKLPIGGFKSLTPMFTVVCKPSEPPYSSDDYLPSVMTCVNYLKLPDYTDLEVMRRRMELRLRKARVLSICHKRHLNRCVRGRTAGNAEVSIFLPPNLL